MMLMADDQTEIPVYSAEQIRDLRTRLGLNQTEAGRRIGISQTLWSDWEKGRRVPSLSHRILLHLLDQGTV